MDTSGFQEPFQPSRRRPRSSRSTSSPLTRPTGAGEADSEVRMFGRIEAVHQSPDGAVVELFRADKGATRFPISLFPSQDWVVANVGRWVALNGKPGGGVIVPAPEETCRHATDPITGDLCLLCGVCGVEMGRLLSADVRSRKKLVQSITEMITAHYDDDHPEILGMFNDPWRKAP